jgi:hypothetical protein
MVDSNYSIKIIHRKDLIPVGFKWMSIEEVKHSFDECKSVLSTWSMVALCDGLV